MLMYQVKQKYFDHGLLEHAKEDYFVIGLAFCKSSLMERYHLHLLLLKVFFIF